MADNAGTTPPTIGSTPLDRVVFPALGWLGKALRTFGIGALVCVALILFQSEGATDRRLSDRLLRTEQAPASPEYLLVEISPSDLREYGRPLMTRENMARLLRVMAQQDPQRVLVDMHFGTQVEPEADRALTEAMALYGPERLGLVSAAGPDDPPDPLFAQYGTIIDARLTPDADGWHRVVGQNMRNYGANAATWLGTGESSSLPMPIDRRIWHEGFELVDAGDVINGRVDVTGRKVVVAAGPDVAPTLAYLPLADTASRARVITVAAQSAQQGYAERMAMGEWINLGLQFLGALLGLGCALMASSARRLVILAAASIFALPVLHSLVVSYFGIPVTLVLSITFFIIMLNTTLVQRFRIMSLMVNFLRGDLSPEEAWAWRGTEETAAPAVLFGADGRVKRHNEAAATLVAQFGKELPGKAQPRPGERASEIALTGEDGQTRWYALDWPYAHLPVASLRDVSEAKARERDLLEQLYNDQLTGCLNRRGLYHRFADIRRRKAAYAVLYLDLNGFKAINDTHGHDVGDALLCRAAGALRSVARPGESVVRLGGDEFAVLIESDTVEQLDLRMEADRFAAPFARPFELREGMGAVRVGAAIGFSRSEEPGEELSSVLKRADERMYSRKAAMKREDLAA